MLHTLLHMLHTVLHTLHNMLHILHNLLHMLHNLLHMLHNLLLTVIQTPQSAPHAPQSAPHAPQSAPHCYTDSTICSTCSTICSTCSTICSSLLYRLHNLLHMLHNLLHMLHNLLHMLHNLLHNLIHLGQSKTPDSHTLIHSRLGGPAPFYSRWPWLGRFVTPFMLRGKRSINQKILQINAEIQFAKGQGCASRQRRLRPNDREVVQSKCPVCSGVNRAWWYSDKSSDSRSGGHDFESWSNRPDFCSPRFPVVNPGESWDVLYCRPFKSRNGMTSGIVRHDSYMQKSGERPRWDFNPVRIGGRICGARWKPHGRCVTRDMQTAHQVFSDLKGEAAVLVCDYFCLINIPVRHSFPLQTENVRNETHFHAADRNLQLTTQYGVVVVEWLDYHPYPPLGEPGSIPVGATHGFSHAGIVPDDTAGRRHFSGRSRIPLPFHSTAALSSALKTLINVQQSSETMTPYYVTSLRGTEFVCDAKKQRGGRKLTTTNEENVGAAHIHTLVRKLEVHTASCV
ncbi:hypothetical protein PR048_002158 [Dryococelus australis]|uniref:Uncharacterized protein n=1 Tax=Dryococelus australis TaxID=614101 RepID=A0ABQ9IK55_9NEOP|nr:hypothetical protein PR048_002158 [Dryococelus australis]